MESFVNIYFIICSISVLISTLFALITKIKRKKVIIEESLLLYALLISSLFFLFLFLNWNITLNELFIVYCYYFIMICMGIRNIIANKIDISYTAIPMGLLILNNTLGIIIYYVILLIQFVIIERYKFCKKNQYKPFLDKE